MQPTIISILGKPLSGKDTVARRLAANLPDAVFINPGEIIREVSSRGQEHRFWGILSPHIPAMEKGIQVPDEAMNPLFETLINEAIAEGKKNIIIAGSPRTLDQLNTFFGFSARIKGILVDVTDGETYRRSAARGEGRVDDNPIAHTMRLDEFNQKIKPVLVKLLHEGRLITVDGMQEKEAVYRDVEKHLQFFVDQEIGLPMIARR